jgi:hypothetical protein
MRNEGGKVKPFRSSDCGMRIEGYKMMQRGHHEFAFTEEEDKGVCQEDY